MATKTPSHIVIIGAGIIGLQTAITLLEADYRVTIVAKHLPGDSSIEYTSPWAGAQWRTHALENDAERCRWDIETYNEWSQVQHEEELNQTPLAERSGLGLYQSCLYWDDAQHPEISNGVENLWWASKVKNFETMPPSELPQHAAVGVRYTAFTIDIPRNLDYLARKVQRLGGKIVGASLDTANGLRFACEQAASLALEAGAGTHVDAFVNATGLGARNIAQDERMYPVRGQTLLVRGTAHKISTRQGVEPGTEEKYIAYVLPRSDGEKTVLGGCKQKGNWDATVDEQLTTAILERCKNLCPELLNEKGEFEVLGAQVGLRPGREGGVRIERETLNGETGGIEIVHAYGHEGAGYQNSVGCARSVLTLINEAVRP